MKTKSNLKILYVHFAVLMFGAAGLFGKLVSLPSIAITFGRVGFSSLFLLLFHIISRRGLHLKSGKHLFMMMLSGIILAAHWSVFYYSIQISTVAIGLLTSATFPVFAAFLEPLVFHEKIKASSLILVAFTLFGIILVTPGLDGGDYFWGAVCGVIAGALYAVLNLFNRYYSEQDYPAPLIACYEQGIAAVVLFPVCLFTVTVSPSAKDLMLLAFLGIIFTGIGHTIFISGLKYIKVQTAGIISCMEPVYGTLFAAFFLSEIPSVREITGGIIILAVSAISSLSPGKPVSRSENH